LKELFEEFKFHLIYRKRNNKAAQPANDHYKELLAELREENRVRRAKIRGLKEAVTSAAHRSEKATRPNTSLQSRIWKPREIDGEMLGEVEGIKENIMVVEQEREGLNSEIANL
jgi:chromosome segregation ATPase